MHSALFGLVMDMFYVSDSTIAMSWCHNVNRKLKPYVRSRVESIRRMIEWTSENLLLVFGDSEKFLSS